VRWDRAWHQCPAAEPARAGERGKKRKRRGRPSGGGRPLSRSLPWTGSRSGLPGGLLGQRVQRGVDETAADLLQVGAALAGGAAVGVGGQAEQQVGTPLAAAALAGGAVHQLGAAAVLALQAGEPLVRTEVLGLQGRGGLLGRVHGGDARG